MCVWICTCDPGGSTISLADSDHLAEAFRDRHCLLSTLTLISMPCLRCPFHSHRFPSTLEQTLRWMRSDRQGSLARTGRQKEWNKGVVKEKKKESVCFQSAKPNRHMLSFYWARIQINILLLKMLVGLMYAVVLSSGWSHIASPEVWAWTKTLIVTVWSSSSGLRKRVGSLKVGHHTFSCMTQFSPLMDEKGLFSMNQGLQQFPVWPDDWAWSAVQTQCSNVWRRQTTQAAVKEGNHGVEGNRIMKSGSKCPTYPKELLPWNSAVAFH